MGFAVASFQDRRGIGCEQTIPQEEEVASQPVAKGTTSLASNGDCISATNN